MKYLRSIIEQINNNHIKQPVSLPDKIHKDFHDVLTKHGFRHSSSYNRDYHRYDRGSERILISKEDHNRDQWDHYNGQKHLNQHTGPSKLDAHLSGKKVSRWD